MMDLASVCLCGFGGQNINAKMVYDLCATGKVWRESVLEASGRKTSL